MYRIVRLIGETRLSSKNTDLTMERSTRIQVIFRFFRRVCGHALTTGLLVCFGGTAFSQVVDISVSSIDDTEIALVQESQIQSQPQPFAPQGVEQPPPTPPPTPPPAPPATPSAVPSPIQQLQQPIAPQPFNPPSANLASSVPSSFGATAGSFSAAPTMMGDFFGGGFSTLRGSQTVFFSDYGTSAIIAGGPGQTNSTLAFELGADLAPNDIFTTGVGQDLAGADGQADTFSILEPVPPTDAPTAPAPGFVFDGGTAVYTNNQIDTTAQPGIYQNGDQWFIQYSYTANLGQPGPSGQAFVPIPAPGVASRRVKISENFSPDVRDRFFANYSFFNDAFGGLGDVSRYVVGFEKVLFQDLVSFEARLPMAGTYASKQSLEGPQDRDFELGNSVFLIKSVLLRSHQMLWTAGMGVGVPIADDTRIQAGGRDVVRINNGTTHLLPFTSLSYRPNRCWSFQSYLQLDVATGGDDVLVNLLGGPLDNLGRFTDSTLVHVDLAATRTLYRNRCSSRIREILGNAELHYTGSLDDSDLISNANFTYSNLKNKFNIVNATTGFHFVMANSLVVSPAMSVPLRDGLDEQFDYEALVQLNYYR